jgi:quercetin dioxygenase-like cupin family protein
MPRRGGGAAGQGAGSAPDRTLALDRVRVDPGAEALHHHQGTQIAFIHKGTLTYTVHRGKATTYRGQSDQKPKVVEQIRAGETAKIRTGEWIVEQPSNHHSAANRGKKPVVIYLANLLRKGAPPPVPG